MEEFNVTSQQYHEIYNQMIKIRRLLLSKKVSPINPEVVKRTLQEIIESVPKSKQEESDSEDFDLSITKKNQIDFNDPPFTPYGFKIEKHLKSELIKFDPLKISLYLLEKQYKEKITGKDLLEELTDKPVMNASFLDYLLEYQHLIPKDWKEKNVFFPGTIYQSSVGGLYFRYLYWGVSQWRSAFRWIHSNFSSNDSVAVVNC